VIFKQVDNRQNGFELPMLPWLKGHLDEEGVQALLQYALSTGPAAERDRESYDNPMVADAGSTIFTLNAGGLSKVVNIYALFEAPTRASRPGRSRRFQPAANGLNDFAARTGWATWSTYEPPIYKVVWWTAFGEPSASAIDWPWDDITRPTSQPATSRAASRSWTQEHVSKLLDVPNGGHVGVWVNDPDGYLVQLARPPLLPDENPEC
jgi:hypothetical protein